MVYGRNWSEFIFRLRGFFETRGFLEVFTDTLVEAGAVESSIDPIRAVFRDGETQLHTSPEIEMKKLLSELKCPIFQIAHCYRDDPPSPIHKREFTMLEFYQTAADYQVMMSLMKELLTFLSPRALDFLTVTVSALFEAHAGIDLSECQSLPALRTAVERQSLHVSESDSWNDLFFKVMVDRIEPALPPDRPVFVTDYPLSTSPMSKRLLGTSLAERFEIYWKGVELCNGCTELTDRGELLARLEREREARKQEGKTPHPISDTFLRAMETIPPCAGVAVGVDRLYSVFSNFSSFSRKQ